MYVTSLSFNFRRNILLRQIHKTTVLTPMSCRGMEAHSSPQTRKRAADLATAIGAHHLDFNIDTVYDSQRALLQSTTGFEAKFQMYGGTKASNLALQNIQARLRMVNAYTLAQLLPQIRGRREGAPGSLLVV
jgi:NAD+ synthase (glutamine-hydrolysing)